jgi:murein DD-endopeptidase MepM/ murein hydrolase activator NlpD
MSRSGKAIFLLSVLLLSCSCRYFRKEAPESFELVPDTLSGEEIKEPVKVFGIPADSFNIVTGHIKRNGFLSELLSEYGVPLLEIEQVLRNSDSVFDVRKIRSGNRYTLLCETDSAARARYMIYEHDPVTCFIFSFNDSLNITPYKKEINRLIRYSSGTIETSLWESMLAANQHPTLAVELSDIFAWTVDFFGLQKGDSYKVIYDELYIDNESLGIGKIYGAEFTWAGKKITAIPFIQDSIETYFDTDGSSLRKAFLKAPLQFSRITSRFSGSRLHPILRIRRPHFGVDYAAPAGTPVHVIGDGKVVEMRSENGSGRMIRVVHNSVYSTAYLHLSRYAEGIFPGSFVKQGDIIGYVGSSGLSTGPHLDFRFYQNGSPVDPLAVEAPPVEPVADENRERFERNKLVVLSLLSTI